ncbi:MAG: shikimate kinase [Promicromonosporaceae bacterium]|nr:shikimate kinase [Promicromonosporaceae bacterium]
MKLIFLGPPGAGKSVVGRRVAEIIDAPFRDTDDEVVATAGKPISDIFTEDGEPAFRALEAEQVATALQGHGGVLALGGGAILDGGTQQLLHAYRQGGGTVVFLDVSITAAAPRIGFNRSRPLLVGNPRARWIELMQARRPIYEALATLTVPTDHLTSAETAEVIAKEMGL